jgi:hypothetical protein
MSYILSINSYLTGGPTLLIAILIELSTRGTAHSDNWFLWLSEQALPRSSLCSALSLASFCGG